MCAGLFVGGMFQAGYYLHHNADSPGSNIGGIRENVGPWELAALCDKTPNCVGFLSDDDSGSAVSGTQPPFPSPQWAGMQAAAHRPRGCAPAVPAQGSFLEGSAAAVTLRLPPLPRNAVRGRHG